MSDQLSVKDALEYMASLGVVSYENRSGEIIGLDANGKGSIILFDLGCSCSEVGSKNANEVGEMLVTLLNAISSGQV